MRILVRDIRQMYKKAKASFNASSPHLFGSAEKYFHEFGIANNMKIIIKEWQGPYPVVESLEFNTEADYMWFILRYS